MGRKWAMQPEDVLSLGKWGEIEAILTFILGQGAIYVKYGPKKVPAAA
jgi:hypothetical protein